jgi:dephospho-CoA kinase
LKKVAVTGDPGSGKSTVCQLFREQGAYVVDADAIVHQLLSSDGAVYRQIVEAFGPRVLTQNRIDRGKLAAVVFSDPAKLTTLEAIVHPAVKRTLADEYARAAKEKQYTLFVAEVALLYEANFASLFDCVIWVEADRKTCEKRFDARHGPGRFAERIRRYFDPKAKRDKADIVIVNSGDVDTLKREVEQAVTNI